MLSKEEILARTDKGLNVFKHYLPFNFRVGRNFLNPLYEDKKASCNVYFDRANNQYKLKDYGNENYSGDCFHFVGKILGTDCRHADSFLEILQKINQDLSLGLDNISKSQFPKTLSPMSSKSQILNPPLGGWGSSPKSSSLESKEEQPKPIKPFSIKVKPFSEVELNYWQQYSISFEILKRYQVVSLKEFASENNEGKPYKLTPSDKEPIFAYQGKRYLKLYRPFSTIRFQYAGDLGDKYCFGLEQLPPKGNILFITGGEKDVLSLDSKGFCAICFNSETSNIPQSIIQKLTYRFKHIVLLYDCDKTGLEASQKHLQQLAVHGVKRMVLPLKGNKGRKRYFRLFQNR